MRRAESEDSHQHKRNFACGYNSKKRLCPSPFNPQYRPESTLKKLKWEEIPMLMPFSKLDLQGSWLQGSVGFWWSEILIHLGITPIYGSFVVHNPS